MAQLIKAGDAKDLQLPGRRSLEILSSKLGSDAVSLRLVEIPVASPATPPGNITFTVIMRNAFTFFREKAERCPIAGNMLLDQVILF